MSIFKNTYDFIENSSLEELTEKLGSYGISFEQSEQQDFNHNEFTEIIITCESYLKEYQAQPTDIYYEYETSYIQTYEIKPIDINKRPKAA